MTEALWDFGILAKNDSAVMIGIFIYVTLLRHNYKVMSGKQKQSILEKLVSKVVFRIVESKWKRKPLDSSVKLGFLVTSVKKFSRASKDCCLIWLLSMKSMLTYLLMVLFLWSKKITTSVSAANVLPEGLTITTDKDISSTAPSKFSVNTLSSFVDSLTSITTDFTQSAFKSNAKVDLASAEPKVKRRRIKHDAQFKAEVIQKKEEGISTSELITVFKSFNPFWG